MLVKKWKTNVFRRIGCLFLITGSDQVDQGTKGTGYVVSNRALF